MCFFFGRESWVLVGFITTLRGSQGLFVLASWSEGTIRVMLEGTGGGLSSGLLNVKHEF